MWQILEGVRDMHEKEIVHRDLKLANILIKDEQILKICDLGLSKCLQGITQEVEYLKYAMKSDNYFSSNGGPEIFEGTAFDQTKI